MRLIFATYLKGEKGTKKQPDKYLVFVFLRSHGGNDFQGEIR